MTPRIITGTAGTGTSAVSAFKTGIRYSPLSGSALPNAAVVVYSKTGAVLGTTTTDANGAFSVSVDSGRNYFIKVTSSDGSSIVSSYVPTVISSSDPNATNVVVNSNSTAVVASIESKLGVNIGASGDSGITDSTIDISGMANQIMSESSFESLVTSIEADIIAGNSTGFSSDTTTAIIAITATTDTEKPVNTTAADFIAGGAAETATTSVQLALAATDDVGVTGYFASEDSTIPTLASSWTDVTATTGYSTTVSFTLSSGNGTKNVNVWFRDAGGNISSVKSDTITLNTNAAGQFSNADMEGIWLFIGAKTDNKADMYFVADNSGNVTRDAMMRQGTSTSNYSINADGSLIVNIVYDPTTISFSGTLTSSTEGTLSTEGVETFPIKKVTDVSACQGDWIGTITETITETESTVYNITYAVDATGVITSFTGFTGPVTGEMYCEGDKALSYIFTGEDSHINKFRLQGSILGNAVSGAFDADSGGDSDGSFTISKVANSKVNGDFRMNVFGGYIDGGAWVSISDLTFDGSGRFTGTELVNSGSSISSSLAGSYTALADGTFGIGSSVNGGISPGGDILLTTDVGSSSSTCCVDVDISVKKSTGMTNANLSGDFLTYNLGYATNNTGNAFSGGGASYMNLIFDGSGGFTITEISNANGVGPDSSGTYTVSADGILSLFGSYAMVSPDGNLIVLAGADPNDLGTLVGVKKSTGMTNASLTGKFHLIHMGHDGTDYWTKRIDITFDGSGGYSKTIVDSSLTDTGTTSTGTYAVADDGTWTMDSSNQGSITSDGNIILYNDTDGTDGAISFMMGIKRS